jgi:hypothetical protein
LGGNTNDTRQGWAKPCDIDISLHLKNREAGTSSFSGRLSAFYIGTTERNGPTNGNTALEKTQEEQKPLAHMDAS